MIQASIWPVVASAIAATLIRYAWYHPRVFGTLWMHLHGVSPEMAERGAKHRRLYLALGLFASFIVAYALRILLVDLGIYDLAVAMRLGALLWLGFAAPILFNSFLFEHRPLSLYLINAGYWFLALIAMSVILIL
jgi:hypothetical protein